VNGGLLRLVIACLCAQLVALSQNLPVYWHIPHGLTGNRIQEIIPNVRPTDSFLEKPAPGMTANLLRLPELPESENMPRRSAFKKDKHDFRMRIGPGPGLLAVVYYTLSFEWLKKKK
jgi:hypothetical protein